MNQLFAISDAGRLLGVQEYRIQYPNESTQKVFLCLFVPILDEQAGGQPLGALMLGIAPEAYLYPSVQRWPTPSETAETLLVRREGNEAVFLNKLRFQENTALNLRVSLDSKELPSAQAALGQEGMVEGIDYRGVPVLAAVRSIHNSPWFLVAKMDAAEVYAPMRERLWLMVITTSTETGNSVSLGRKYALASGLMEITYKTGAIVTIEGPVIYEAELNGGYLSVGKMMAKLGEKKGDGQCSLARSKFPDYQSPIPKHFIIRTPTTIVTDLGTEFGVEIGSDGVCEVHVLKGLVQTDCIGSGGHITQSIRLKEGQGRQYKPAHNQLTVIPFNRTKFEQMHINKTKEQLSQWLAYSRQLCTDPALMAYYNFEPAGSDSSVLINSASSGSILDGKIDGPLWTTGRFPNKCALRFRGLSHSDKVVLPDPSRFAFRGAFSLAVWFKADGLFTGHDALISKGNSSWRLQQANGANTLSFDTTVADDVAPPKVLSLSRATVRANSDWPNISENLLPANAFDGDSNTGWASADTPNWICVDLGSDMRISKVKIDWENSYSHDYTLGILPSEQGDSDVPSQYAQVASVLGRKIGLEADQLSPGNRANWDDIFNFETGTVDFDRGNARSASACSDAVGRYLMLHSTATKNGIACVWEIQVEASPISKTTVMPMHSRTRVDDSRWHFAVVVCEPRGNAIKKRLYMDGRLDAESDCPTPLNHNSQPVWIGANSQAPYLFAGLIDEVAIFVRALSANEVEAMYNHGCSLGPNRN